MRLVKIDSQLVQTKPVVLTDDFDVRKIRVKRLADKRNRLGELFFDLLIGVCLDQMNVVSVQLEVVGQFAAVFLLRAVAEQVEISA